MALHKSEQVRVRRSGWIVTAWAGLIALFTSGSALPSVDSAAEHQVGLISWYGENFQQLPTANGEPFDPSELTMAHPSLPFGTQVRVTNLRNGRSVVVRVNDRGPFVARRIADVSKAAARLLGMVRSGVVRARLEVVDEPSRSS